MSTRSPLLKWMIWVLAAIFYFYEFVLKVSPSVMIGDLMQSFTITASSIGILSACYMYAYAPMQLPVGLLLDRFGIKKVLSIASLVCGIGALFFASAHTLVNACIGRLFIGVGSAFAFIAMVYITSHWFPRKKRAFLIGVANSLAMLGASAGGGPLTECVRRFGWRETIGFFGFFGILLSILIYFLLQQDRHTEEVEEETAQIHKTVFSSLKAVLSHKATWINAFVALFFYMTTTAFGGLWGVSFIETAYKVDRTIAGYAISMVFLGWMVGGPIMGFFSDHREKRSTPIRLGIVGTLLSLCLVLYFPTYLPITVVYGLLFLLGLFSSAELLNFSLAIELNHPGAKATAAAFTNFMISCGDALILPLVGYLLDTKWSGGFLSGVRLYTTQDYQFALSCLPISLLLAFFLLFFVKEKRMKL